MTVTPRPPDDRRGDGKRGSSASAESVAFLLLAGVAVGLGVVATVTTVYMAQLLSRYRSRRRGLPDPLAAGVGKDPDDDGQPARRAGRSRAGGWPPW